MQWTSKWICQGWSERPERSKLIRRYPMQIGIFAFEKSEKKVDLQRTRQPCVEHRRFRTRVLAFQLSACSTFRSHGFKNAGVTAWRCDYLRLVRHETAEGCHVHWMFIMFCLDSTEIFDFQDLPTFDGIAAPPDGALMRLDVLWCFVMFRVLMLFDLLWFYTSWPTDFNCCVILLSVQTFSPVLLPAISIKDTESLSRWRFPVKSEMLMLSRPMEAKQVLRNSSLYVQKGTMIWLYVEAIYRGLWTVWAFLHPKEPDIPLKNQSGPKESYDA